MMSIWGDKKRIERRFLNAVLSTIGQDSPFQVPDYDEENPDFTIQFGAECVGVEVTQCHHSQTSRGSRNWEGACEAVMTAAQILWERKGLPRVLVNVSFNKDILFPKNRWAEMAEKLVACAQQALPPVGRQAVVGAPGVFPYHAVNVTRPTEVVYMIISPEPSLPFTLWHCGTGGTVQYLTKEIVQDVIDRKRGRLAEYRKKAPTIWLIVGLEQARYSDYFMINNPSVLDDLDKGGFERLFLVPLAEKVFYELCPTRALKRRYNRPRA